ncbi:uncharacterized protein BX664DRAFT_21986 [Halteromyces radiatus]|uniref:uncharacterized protein n=1 Tax=Halteromyces radiatus TaxID=101107 RepID=UPI00221EFE21|nr:uncharacterized protein BX664DRAFT_21986 [Halteromyces radiatus]KAI8099476.1 hypothetical protein BX664DRAFT_21986 [Halteromyces radiatus]
MTNNIITPTQDTTPETFDWGTISFPVTEDLLISINTNTKDLQSIVNGDEIDTQQLFVPDQTTDDLVSNDLIEEWNTDKEMNVNPFLNPDRPFRPSDEEAETLLHMTIPCYLYNLKELKERQLYLRKEETLNLIPVKENKKKKKLIKTKKKKKF